MALGACTFQKSTGLDFHLKQCMTFGWYLKRKNAGNPVNPSPTCNVGVEPSTWTSPHCKVGHSPCMTPLQKQENTRHHSRSGSGLAWGKTLFLLGPLQGDWRLVSFSGKPKSKSLYITSRRQGRRRRCFGKFCHRRACALWGLRVQIHELASRSSIAHAFLGKV